jgi:DNA-binding NarL/FixJ family response regulator
LLGLIQVRREFPSLGVVIVSATQDSRTIANAIQEGAMGYIPKSTQFEDIQLAITDVLNGKRWLPKDIKEELNKTPSEEDSLAITRLADLTPQQLKVLTMIGKGYLNKQIATELGIKETTIKTHVSEILRKLNIRNRTQAAVFSQFLDVSD